MKAYITCPVSHTQNRLHLLPLIEEIVHSLGIESFVFQIGGAPKEIFSRDIKQLQSCNLLIAEVSERSHGVGIEIGLSIHFGLQRILLHEKGTSITPLAHGIPDTQIIEYTTVDDLKSKLFLALNTVKKV
jgi:hypothetical protein